MLNDIPYEDARMANHGDTRRHLLLVALCREVAKIIKIGSDNSKIKLKN